MNPTTRKNLFKLLTQPSFRAVGQTHVEWQTKQQQQLQLQQQQQQQQQQETHIGELTDANIRTLSFILASPNLVIPSTSPWNNEM